jgi:diacylglycerol diphosphate phosphatase/phosphatidate phosphatase
MVRSPHEAFEDGLTMAQIQFLAEPFHRMFFINNINIMYPHALVERVPVSWNIAYAVGVPLLSLIVWLSVSRASLHKFHVSILGLLIR